MILLNLTQGSPEWKQARKKYRTASEASVMKACSKNQTRDELLWMAYSGDEQVFSDYVQREILDNGHEVEAMARPLAEEVVGDDLYPVTATDDSGYLLASCDGLTDWGTVGWECKQWNSEKAATVQAGEVPECDKWQVIQQLVVTGAQKWLYMVTDGTPAKCVYTWYSLQPGDQEALRAGWCQFESDLASYSPPEPKPAVTGNPLDSLPTPVIELAGAVTANTLPEFRARAEAMLKAIPEELQSDQDFADAEVAVKALKTGEKQLAAAKDAALSKTADIEEVFRTLGDVSEMIRQKRLALEKLVKAQKETVRKNIILTAQQSLQEHINAMPAAVSTAMPALACDFAAAIKGKKTVSSLQSAANDELARGKIEADKWRKAIEGNLATFEELAIKPGFQSLFADLNQLVLKPAADFEVTVQFRIAQHKEAEEQRKAEEAHAEAAAKAKPEPVKPGPQSTPDNDNQRQPIAFGGDPVRTLADALRHFCRVKGMGEQDALELLDIVGSFQVDLTQEAA